MLTVIYSQAGPLIPEEKLKRKAVRRKQCRAHQVTETTISFTHPTQVSLHQYHHAKLPDVSPALPPMLTGQQPQIEYRTMEVLSSTPREFIVR